MAIRLPDGSIRMHDGRVIYADTVIQGRDLLEIVPLLAPPAWPFVSGGGSGIRSQTSPGASGATGGAGPQGNQGFQGLPIGVPGPQGSQGLQGTNPGPQGPQGNQGVQGFQGLTGSGAQGNQGVPGNQGNQGSQGQLGPQGNQGNFGPQGNQGLQGDLGPQGFQGSQGPQGSAGLGGGVLYTSTGSSSLGANQTRFLGAGNTPFSSTENQVQILITRPGTLQNLAAMAISNTRADATTVIVRKNGISTAIAVIIPAGSTAFFQDTVDTVAVVAGDEVSIQISTGGGGGNIALAASVEIA